MPIEFGQNYDFENKNIDSPVDVSCISLGCWCGVASCLNSLSLRDTAYPFDWNRTTMYGIIHFLRTGFSDFLHFTAVKPFPESKSSKGQAFLGAHHSIWHEDCSSQEADGTEKYHRRINRLLQNPAPRLLFIRALNSDTEVNDGEELLAVLRSLFPKSQVYLLLIADCQLAAKSYLIEGTDGGLIVATVDRRQWPTGYAHEVDAYKEAINMAYHHALADGELSYPYFFSARSCYEVHNELVPFFGGPPNEVPFSPYIQQAQAGAAPGPARMNVVGVPPSQPNSYSPPMQLPSLPPQPSGTILRQPCAAQALQMSQPMMALQADSMADVRSALGGNFMVPYFAGAQPPFATAPGRFHPAALRPPHTALLVPRPFA